MVSQERLEALGDPSGHKDAGYWNEWFDIVCKQQQHRSFEWYCGCDEVVRVLRYHIESKGVEGTVDGPHESSVRMVHPGSGTSLLPLELRRVYPRSEQVVLDVAELALQEMKEHHEKHHDKSDPDERPIRYVLTDALEPPLDFADGSFDAWIDKGFLDAVFDRSALDTRDGSDGSQSVPRRMFVEASRLLKAGRGVMVVVTLAESHSLGLILDSWMNPQVGQGHPWSPTLHIWELKPVSGAILPLAIVLLRSTVLYPGADSKSTSTSTLPPKQLVWHRNDGQSNSDGIVTLGMDSIDENDTDAVFAFVDRQFQRAQDRFAEHIDSANGRTNGDGNSHERNENHRLLAAIEVKPYEAGLDMLALGGLLTSIQWKRPDGSMIPIHWQSDDPVRSDDADHTSFIQVIPIGFGISKIRLRCIVDSDDVDDLVYAISEWEGNQDSSSSDASQTFEGVQSVDVDWRSTIPVMPASSLPKMP